MEIFIESLILVLSIGALWLGAVWVVESASRIAKKLGISELVIGLTVVALGTSAPEFAVTITAAVKGQAAISVGNIVGSNIFNLGFILGGVALIRPIRTSRKLVYRDGSLLIIAAILLLVFFYDDILKQWEGIVLVLVLLSYLIFLFIKKENIEEDIPSGPYRWYEIPKLLIGLTFIVAGGHFLVDSASFLARAIGISEWVIAVTIVAAGTSTPELATSLVAVIKGKHALSAGNLIGSDLFNLLGVLGLAGFLRPQKIDPSSYVEIIVMSGMIILVVFMMGKKWRLSRADGAILVLINLIRWIINFTA